MRTLTLFSLAALFTVGCRGSDDTADTDTSDVVDETDADGDGYAADVDCDDNDAAVNPGAIEICNGKDDNCSGTIDDGATDATTWFADSDGDGYGDDGSTVTACEAPSGYVAQGGDCDDSDAKFHPGADESDCDDPADYNCDGSVGAVDADGDGFDACADCNDGDAAVYPGATETCNGVDDDCDGTVDNNATDGTTFYADADGDGFGNTTDTTSACSLPAGYAEADGDCDDASSTTYPGAPELCNGADDDCDGEIDEEATDGTTWYADADGDTHGDATTTAVACAAPAGFVASSDDCDDANAAAFPGGTEVCDGADNDCNGSIDDDATDFGTFYADSDGDGYGDAGDSVQACSAPGGYVADGTDCNDADADVSPGATELCDDTDRDCDGETHDDDAGDATTWYTDADADGFGDDASATTACDQPTDLIDVGGDCDDAEPTVYPGAPELCDGLDNDCDGITDPEEDVLGLANACSATNCVEILDVRPGAKSGAYSLDAGDPARPFRAYCEMVYDGGGWALAMKADGTKTTWSYDQALWTTTAAPTGNNIGFNRLEGKAATFNRLAFNEVLVGMESPIKASGAISPTYLKLELEGTSLLDVFKGGYQPTTVGRSAWKGLITNSSLQANCNMEGFNVNPVPGSSHSRVRIGIVSNQENNCGSPDSRLGVGGQGTACGQVDGNSSGNEAQCSPDNGIKSLRSFSWVFVR